MNFVFPYIGNVIIPTDELIFFRAVGLKPPTSIAIGVNKQLSFFINQTMGKGQLWLMGSDGAVRKAGLLQGARLR